ncbi:MAG: hypothetical protein ACXU95_17755 [Isosphaeraceae bacterium]
MAARVMVLYSLASAGFIAMFVVRLRFDLARMHEGIPPGKGFRGFSVRETVTFVVLALISMGLFLAGGFAEPLKDVTRPWSQWPWMVVMTLLLFQMIAWEPMIRKRANRIANTPAGTCLNGHHMLVSYCFCPVCAAPAAAEPKQPKA